MNMETEQYANDLIEKYIQYADSIFDYGYDEEYQMKNTIIIAIIDVNNTIEALGTSSYNLKKKIYYKEVLTILKSKL